MADEIQPDASRGLVRKKEMRYDPVQKKWITERTGPLIPTKFFKPEGTFHEREIWEYYDETGRKVKHLIKWEDGKKADAYYFEDTWEPIVHLALDEDPVRWVGYLEMVRERDKPQRAIENAAKEAAKREEAERVRQAAAPPPPPGIGAPGFGTAPATVAAPSDPNGCPCKQKLTDGEKGILNFGLSNEMLKNPNAAAIGIARQLGGANAFKIEQLISAAEVGGPIGLLNDALPSLLQGQNKLNELQGIVNGFEAECNRLTDPRQLVNIISSLSLYGELACALGIEGLDIGGGLQVVNENGQLGIQFAVAANVDLEKVLNQFDPGLGTATAGAVESLRAGLDSALKTLDEANAAIQSVVDATTAIQNEAANFIQQYTSINSLANLVNEANTDPCFKLGSTLNGSLVSSDFLNAVRGGSPTGFGTSAR